MNNLKKIGLSALAGSMVAFSANAVDVAVTGDAQAVFSTAQGNQSAKEASNGRGIGVDTDLYFTAKGELDNGWNITVFTAMDTEQSNTATSGGLNSSSQLTIGMGSMGTVQFNDVSGSAANGIDDVLPKAYEEAWDGTSHASSFHTFGSATQSGSIDYRTPSFEMAGATMSATYTYDPNGGVGAPGAGAVGADAGSGAATTVKASMEGFTLGLGYEETDGGGNGDSGVKHSTGYVLYSYGPVSVGYQKFEVNPNNNDGSKGTAAVGQDIDGDGYAVSYAVNDSLSLSYSRVEEKRKHVGVDQTEVATKMDAVQAAYTMGGMTLGASLYSTDNPGFQDASKYEETEISVSFAF
jgi:outer membrane protein OmpU